MNRGSCVAALKYVHCVYTVQCTIDCPVYIADTAQMCWLHLRTEIKLSNCTSPSKEKKGSFQVNCALHNNTFKPH